MELHADGKLSGNPFYPNKADLIPATKELPNRFLLEDLHLIWLDPNDVVLIVIAPFLHDSEGGGHLFLR
jgi:hypothetical protein